MIVWPVCDFIWLCLWSRVVCVYDDTFGMNVYYCAMCMNLSYDYVLLLFMMLYVCVVFMLFGCGPLRCRVCCLSRWRSLTNVLSLYMNLYYCVCGDAVDEKCGTIACSVYVIMAVCAICCVCNLVCFDSIVRCTCCMMVFLWLDLWWIYIMVLRLCACWLYLIASSNMFYHYALCIIFDIVFVYTWFVWFWYNWILIMMIVICLIMCVDDFIWLCLLSILYDVLIIAFVINLYSRVLLMVCYDTVLFLMSCSYNCVLIMLLVVSPCG